MINDFNEIKNEKDREIYVQCRQILDNWFILEQKGHEDKNHSLYECWNKELEVIKTALVDVAKAEGMTHADAIRAMHNTEFELMRMFQYMIVICIVSNEMGAKH